MFGKHKKETAVFDQQRQEAVLRISICTGEKTLIFREKSSGRLEQIACVRGEEELEKLCRQYQIPPEKIRREW